MMFKTILIIAIIIVSGCTGPRILVGITTPDKGSAAVILGEGSTSVLDVISFLITPITGGEYDSRIYAIDGKKVSETGEGKEWWLVPGNHTLGIRCDFNYGGISEFGRSDLNVSVKLGNVYQLRSIPTKQRKCISKIENITGRVGELP